MSISSATRKLLWSRAHNTCAKCKEPLTVDADSAELPGLILGEEAHIVARSEQGPRGLEGDRSDLDGYDNIILLCADDHKRVDSQPSVYSVEALLRMKSDHEAWAEKRFAGQAYLEPLRLERTVDEDSVPFVKVTTGRELWKLTDHTYSRYFSSVDGAVVPEAEAAADALLDALNDWADVSEDVAAGGFAAVREAQASLQELIDEVTAHHLHLLGRRILRTLTGGNAAPSPWPIVQVLILREDQIR